MHCSLDGAKAIAIVNTQSSFPSSQVYAPRMTARSYGRIVNTTSLGADGGTIACARYDAAGAIMLTKQFARQCAAIVPGPIATVIVAYDYADDC